MTCNYGASEASIRASTAQEYRVLTRCHHEGIVRLYSAFISTVTPALRALIPDETAKLIFGDDGAAWVDVMTRFAVFEKADCDLEHFRKMYSRIFPFHEFSRKSLQLCEALEYLNKRSIVHLDLKLNNILVMSDGALKLADFGNSAELRVWIRWFFMDCFRFCLQSTGSDSPAARARAATLAIPHFR